MTTKEEKLIASLGIAPILLDWDIDKLWNREARKVIKSYTKKLDEVLEEGRSIFIYMKNSVQAQRLGVYVLQGAIKQGYTSVGYVTPSQLAEATKDSWEESQWLSSILNRKILMVDGFSSRLEPFVIKCTESAIEKRLMYKKATIVVGLEPVNACITQRLKEVFDVVDVFPIEEDRDFSIKKPNA